MENDKKIALILCLDENKENKYEYECLFSIYSWRNIKHNLANIDIIVYINKNNNINISTLNKLKTYNVQFRYFEPPKFNHILLNVVYCLYLFEKYESHKYTYGIYIDLDVYLLNAIPSRYIFSDKNIFIYYNYNNIFNTCYKQHILNDASYTKRIFNCYKLNIYPINTEFIILNCKTKIYEKIFLLIQSSEYQKFFNQNILYNNDLWYFEEGLYDYAYKTNIININNSIFINFKYFEQLNKNKYSIFKHQHICSLNEYINLLKTFKY